LLRARLLRRMQESSNLATKILVSTKKLSKSTLLQLPLTDMRQLTDDDIKSCQRQLEGRRMSAFCETTQGSGRKHFVDTPRLFLANPRARAWTERAAIDALKIRASMFLTRELAARTVARGENIDTTCRGYHVAVESQLHILGKCRATQAERVNRHSSVCANIARRLRTGSGTGARSIAINRDRSRGDKGSNKKDFIETRYDGYH